MSKLVNRKLTTQNRFPDRLIAPLTLNLVLLAGCSSQSALPATNATSNEEYPAQEPVNAPAEEPPSSASRGPLNPPAPGEPGGLPDDRTPIAEAPIDPKSAQGAAQVVQQYFALLESGAESKTRKLWSNGQPPAEFTDRLAQYREIHANIGAPGDSEGAAGSIYVDVPVQMYGRLRDGKEFNARGTITLRRVNDVPGSTAEQRRWHIYKANFPKQTAANDRFVGKWAAKVSGCSTQAWRFTADSLRTPAGSQCTFRKVTEVAGGYDIAARCTAEGPPKNDTLMLRFAESAKALLFESKVISDAGLVRCG